MNQGENGIIQNPQAKMPAALNSGDIQKLVHNSITPEDVAEKFGNLLHSVNVNLLFLAMFDTRKSVHSHTICNNFPKEVERSASAFDNLRECPVVQSAMQFRKPFDALNFDYRNIREQKQTAHISVLRDIGHNQLLVVPFQVGRTLFTMIIGMNLQQTSEQFQENMVLAVDTLLNKTVSKFPELLSVGRDIQKDELNHLETGILYDLQDGQDLEQIGAAHGMSALAIKIILDNCAKKLKLSSYFELAARSVGNHRQIDC